MTPRHIYQHRCFQLSRTLRLPQAHTHKAVNTQHIRWLFVSQKRANMSPIGYSHIPTPAKCYVDFCLVPVGTGTVSVAKEVAEVQKVLKASGLSYTMHSAGTTVEGSWDDVMKVVGQAHSVVHQMGAVRIQTSMRVGSRTDKAQTAAEKVKRVEGILAEDGRSD